MLENTSKKREQMGQILESIEDRRPKTLQRSGLPEEMRIRELHNKKSA